PGQELAGRREGDLEVALDHARRADRTLEQVVQESEEPTGGLALAVQAEGVLALKAQDRARRGGGFGGDLLDPAQEEAEPGLPRAVVTDRLQPIVVLLPVTLEVVAQVEQ